MLELSNSNFKQEIEDYKGIAVVDFWASWCGPCQTMGPIFEETAKEMEGKTKFAKLNVDESQDIASKFSVMSIPTIIFFKDGREVERKVGAQAKEAIIEAIRRLEKEE